MLSIFQSAGFKSAKSYVETLDKGASEWMAWPAVRKRVLDVLKAYDKSHGLPADASNQEIVLTTIHKLLWDDLTSGEHHTYRGVLSGQGHDRKGLFSHFEMVRFSKKLITIEQSEQVLRDLDHAIKAAG